MYIVESYSNFLFVLCKFITYFCELQIILFNLIMIPDIFKDIIEKYKKGGKIHIKKENRGKFTDYCNGKVTNECISRGKRSPNPKVRKMATFAANARAWAKKK